MIYQLSGINRCDCRISADSPAEAVAVYQKLFPAAHVEGVEQNGKDAGFVGLCEISGTAIFEDDAYTYGSEYGYTLDEHMNP